MAAWRIYYDDGSTFDGEPELAPKTGIQVIAQPDPDHGYHLLHSFDFYWWTGAGWYGGDIFGLWDYLTQPGWKIVLFGRSIPTPRWREIMQRAGEEKTGWQPRERRGF